MATILLVDDERHIRLLLRRELTDRGYEVTDIGCPRKAEELIKQVAFDIVLTDIRMPGLDGLEITRLVKSHQPAAHVILMTGFGSVDTATEGLRLGAFDYLLKPFGDLELVMASIGRAVKTQELLAETERLQGKLIHSDSLAQEVYARFTNKGVIRFLSPAWTQLVGWGTEDCIGKAITEYLSEQGTKGWDRLQKRIHQTSPLPPQDELEFLRQDGSIRYGEVRIALDASGDIIASIRDVSDRRRLQLEVAQSSKLEALGRLAGSIAHDFNNMLTAILGYSELLSEAVDDSLKEDLDVVIKTTERASRLTRQLLVFSRQQAMKSHTVDLKEVLDDAMDVIRVHNTHGVTIETFLEPGVCLVDGDATQLEQVLLNLVLNGIDATPSDGKVTIQASPGMHPNSDRNPSSEDACIVLTVRDTGCGMSTETLNCIFEPYFTTKGPEKGTGLGLATVYGVVKQSGGDIVVDSVLGKGTTFDVYLPQSKKQIERIIDTPHQVTPPMDQNKHILVVEDEASLRDLVAKILSRSGYTVHKAENGRAALDLAKSLDAPFDLLLTDIVMPFVGGVELAQQLTEDDPELKVAFMSGFPDGLFDSEDSKENRDRDAPFLAKPFTPAQLLSAVRTALG